MKYVIIINRMELTNRSVLWKFQKVVKLLVH